MKKNIVICCLILLGVVTASEADIFSQQSSMDLYSAYEKDVSGYSYNTGVNYRPTPKPKDQKIYSSTNMSLGCSGFNFSSNFQNMFSKEALSDTLSGASSQMMSAAPLVLLEYISPTLADVTKHFSNLTSLKLGDLYAQCEDIEAMASDKMDKLRKQSEMECIKTKNYSDIDKAMAECKAQSDPFAFLKDANGIPLSGGGEINIIKETLERVFPDFDQRTLASEITGEVNIKKDGYEVKPAQKDFATKLNDNSNDIETGLKGLVEDYRTKGTINGTDRLKYTAAGNPLTEHQIKNLSLLDDPLLVISLSNLASHLAYWKTIDEFQSTINGLRGDLLNPQNDDERKDVIREEIVKLKDQIEKAEKERKILKEYNNIQANILSAAERQRLKSLLIHDKTNLYSKEAELKEEKEQLLLPSNLE